MLEPRVHTPAQTAGLREILKGCATFCREPPKGSRCEGSNWHFSPPTGSNLVEDKEMCFLLKEHSRIKYLKRHHKNFFANLKVYFHLRIKSPFVSKINFQGIKGMRAALSQLPLAQVPCAGQVPETEWLACCIVHKFLCAWNLSLSEFSKYSGFEFWRVRVVTLKIKTMKIKLMRSIWATWSKGGMRRSHSTREPKGIN